MRGAARAGIITLVGAAILAGAAIATATIRRVSRSHA